MYNENLKKYICLNPFNYLEIHKKIIFTCCPSWLNTSVGKTEQLKDVWNGEVLNNIRSSILDGSYSFCDKDMCPFLSELIHNNNTGEVFIHKDSFNPDRYKKGPSRISLCFDSSCNLSCPSCRKRKIVETKKTQKKINETMNNIMVYFGDSVQQFSISGTSDPFASKTFRDFLINFDNTKFPRIEGIYLQTNGILLTEKMWKKIEKSRKYIYMLSVSIDAATEKTYKIVRRGGDWKILQKNLKFISSLNKPKTYTFVVQDTNYKEMKLFYDMIYNLRPNGEYKIYFGKINDWGVMSQDEYNKKEIWNENHPDFNLFLNELKKIAGKHNVITNMNDIIKKYSLIKTRTQLI